MRVSRIYFHLLIKYPRVELLAQRLSIYKNGCNLDALHHRIVSLLVSVMYLIEALICIPLRSTNIQHIFLYILAIHTSFYEVYSKSLTAWVFALLLIGKIVYILWIQVLCQIYILQIFTVYSMYLSFSK